MTKEEFLAIPTPRTDLAIANVGNLGDHMAEAMAYVLSRLACQLERELYIANEWNKKAHEKARRQMKEEK